MHTQWYRAMCYGRGHSCIYDLSRHQFLWYAVRRQIMNQSSAWTHPSALIVFALCITKEPATQEEAILWGHSYIIPLQYISLFVKHRICFFFNHRVQIARAGFCQFSRKKNCFAYWQFFPALSRSSVQNHSEDMEIFSKLYYGHLFVL